MKKTIFTGAATAIITPMKDGKIDYESFERIINLWLKWFQLNSNRAENYIIFLPNRAKNYERICFKNSLLTEILIDEVSPFLI